MNAVQLPADLASHADLGLDWKHGFAALGPDFYAEPGPEPLPHPYWVAGSDAVARLIGLDAARWQSDQALRVLSGNAVAQGSRPLASVYSGHQFGVWAGQLGDGRALLLGETALGQEIQLKGAGRTPYSRMGDGRAVLRSSIREFLCCEAMHGLGIASTRALCITGSPAAVRREEVETAAVVTRVAPSFVRFGHFEHFAANALVAPLQALADYVIARYYPACRAGAQPYAALLQAVSERTARLIAQWQAAGFCHGVMNTDNMSILGLGIDYGPFQFLDAFDPGHVCNHSDTQGRYAYDRQPAVAHWNLLCLAQALLPLIAGEDLALAALDSYRSVFEQAYTDCMRAKLGLPDARAGDAELIGAILTLLARQRVDYPIFWRRLSQARRQDDFAPVRALFTDGGAFDPWLLAYSQRMAQGDRALAAESMLRCNPRFVLRNHLGEQAIRAAQGGDFQELRTLQTLLERPFDEHPGHEAYADFPPDWAASISISCSS